ncbi:MAG: PASTA domain-containing protein [Chloroflexi bacterium]|nr:MAG: PASTA domain-containing protein [Chloroflexota bacterium]
MSSNANGQRKKTGIPETPYDELWRSGRSRFGVQQLRLGRDKKWHFVGQLPDETVVKIMREHWWFLVKSALPLFVVLVALILIIWGSGKLASPIWPFLKIIAGVAILGALAWFIWKDFIEWYLNTYIVTNKRIIHSHGVLQPERQSTPLDNVKQVGMDLDTFWGFLLRYGTVHVYLVGGDFIMKNVPNPRAVKDTIDDITEKIRASKPQEQKPPTPDNPQVAEVIHGLAKAKEPPPLENADEKYILRNPEGRLGPRRTFGGILRIPCEVRYLSGEYTVRYIQRSRYVFYRKILLPILALCIFLPLSVYVPATSTPIVSSHLTLWWIVMGIIVVLLALSIGIIYTNYVDDVYILSNKRIFDIQRHFIFFFENRRELEYKNIKDIKVKVPNVLQRLLDIGDVYIDIGGAPTIILPTVDHPFFVLDKINEIKAHVTKAEALKKDNELKKELHDWFGKVVTSLVDSTQMKGAPNLGNMDLLEAMGVANELGFHVAVYGEEPRQDIPPGRVVRQSPPSGTVIQPGGEIQVVLAKRATTADLMEY